MPIGSNLVFNNWSIHVDSIETVQSIDWGGSPTLPKNGRFAILHLSLTNTGPVQAEESDDVIGSAIFDSSKGIFPADAALTTIETFSQSTQTEVSPQETIPMTAVYDISSNGQIYFLCLVLENKGVLLDMPSGISNPDATPIPLPSQASGH